MGSLRRSAGRGYTRLKTAAAGWRTSGRRWLVRRPWPPAPRRGDGRWECPLVDPPADGLNVAAVAGDADADRDPGVSKRNARRTYESGLCFLLIADARSADGYCGLVMSVRRLRDV